MFTVGDSRGLEPWSRILRNGPSSSPGAGTSLLSATTIPELEHYLGDGREWAAGAPAVRHRRPCWAASPPPRGQGGETAPRPDHPDTGGFTPGLGRGGQVAHETTSHTQLLALSSSEMKQKMQLLGCIELSAPRAWSRALGSERTRFCHHRRLLDAALEAMMKGN